MAYWRNIFYKLLMDYNIQGGEFQTETPEQILAESGRRVGLGAFPIAIASASRLTRLIPS